jgi:UDP-N-acetyl-D-glucosamine dehydrogenase
VATRFIELAGEINAAMPAYVVQRLMGALNERGKALKGARVLVLGAAYKRDTDDPRESPSLEIMEELIQKGAAVEYSDPHLPRLPAVRRHQIDLASVALTEASLRAYDAVLLVTDHSRFPYELIHRSASLIVDSRNAFRARGLAGPHVVSA